MLLASFHCYYGCCRPHACLCFLHKLHKSSFTLPLSLVQRTGGHETSVAVTHIVNKQPVMHAYVELLSILPFTLCRSLCITEAANRLSIAAGYAGCCHLQSWVSYLHDNIWRERQSMAYAVPGTMQVSLFVLTKHQMKPDKAETALPLSTNQSVPYAAGSIPGRRAIFVS